MKQIQPRSAKEMILTLTGIFEGGSYCSLADNPNDALGGLSFGKHQASERQGTLYALLRAYVNRTDDPAPHPFIASEVWRHIKLFGTGGTVYCGGPLQREDFKTLLRSVCVDPAMERTQDEFFERNYYVPAMSHAARYGVTSLLGRCMLYDIAVQSGPAHRLFYTLALDEWNQRGTQATACAPHDPNGPLESWFLDKVNGLRRDQMEGSKSKAYAASMYRPFEFGCLMKAGNFDLSKDFEFRGRMVKGLQGVAVRV